uniref:Uncharacterized protein n=1 Tax=Timema genevievae TaxID=629358 RepID=A0A7R9JVD4_TIMGE|nr:unnamed protein product [Timema genevievae]
MQIKCNYSSPMASLVLTDSSQLTSDSQHLEIFSYFEVFVSGSVHLLVPSGLLEVQSLDIKYPELPIGKTGRKQSQHILQIGSSVDIDVLKYDEDSCRAILRCPATSYVKLRSSLTLCGDYSGIPCAYRVHNASPCLLSLLGNSRTYQHN